MPNSIRTTSNTQTTTNTHQPHLRQVTAFCALHSAPPLPPIVSANTPSAKATIKNIELCASRTSRKQGGLDDHHTNKHA
ncbi:hypothetical protein [Psychrobacter sp.]|uniref:hypothetical protein n=1 Tax=Psychrobacter sp. TaxID=56811 RepID=UPI003BAF4939